MDSPQLTPHLLDLPAGRMYPSCSRRSMMPCAASTFTPSLLARPDGRTRDSSVQAYKVRRHRHRFCGEGEGRGEGIGKVDDSPYGEFEDSFHLGTKVEHALYSFTGPHSSTAHTLQYWFNQSGCVAHISMPRGNVSSS